MEFKVGQILQLAFSKPDTLYVYEIRNKLNGKNYVGITKDPIQRLRGHKGSSYSRLSDAIQAVGIQHFEMEILEICTGNKRQAGKREEFWIKKKNSLIPSGYNSQPKSNWAPNMSPEAVERRRLLALKAIEKANERWEQQEQQKKERKEDILYRRIDWLGRPLP